VRSVGKIVSALIIFCGSLLLVLFAFILVCRVFETIWLPFTLAAVVGALLQLSPAPRSVRQLLWAAIGCGAVLFWTLSSPEVSLYIVRWLSYLILGFGAWLAAACIGCLSVLGIRSFSGPIADRRLYAWGLALVLMSWLVAYFSSPSGGSGGMIDAAMHLFGLSAENAKTVVFVVRKSLHFSFYGLLGLAGFKWASASGAPIRRAVLVGLSIALAHAAYDESRQTFFPNRTGSAWDVLLDLAGASVFVGLASRKREQARALPD
jgi:VanZ family protein